MHGTPQLPESKNAPVGISLRNRSSVRFSFLYVTSLPQDPLLRLQHEVGKRLALTDCGHTLQLDDLLLAFHLNLFRAAHLRFVLRAPAFRFVPPAFSRRGARRCPAQSTPWRAVTDSVSLPFWLVSLSDMAGSGVLWRAVSGCC